MKVDIYILITPYIYHVTLRIKVKKKYSEWIWRFEAREGKKVKYVFANTTAQRENKSAGEIFVSRQVFFANTPPKHDISVQNTYMVLFNILHSSRRAVLFNNLMTKYNKLEFHIHLTILIKARNCSKKIRQYKCI
jgi:hypothetical protein